MRRRCNNDSCRKFQSEVARRHCHFGTVDLGARVVRVDEHVSLIRGRHDFMEKRQAPGLKDGLISRLEHGRGGYQQATLGRPPAA